MQPERVTEPVSFVLQDAAVVAVAVAAAVGAWRGGGPGLLVGGAVLALALVVRRPALVCVAVAVLAAGLADRALAGLDRPEPAGVHAWATLVTDPVRVDTGGVRVDIALDGRRVEATAFGAAAGRLADGLAGEQVELTGTLRPAPPPQEAPWLLTRRVVGRVAIEEIGARAPGSTAARAANGLRRTLAEGAAHLPTVGRSLLAGVVLGDDREQPAEVTDDFLAAGLTHLLAVSGSNVAFTLALAGPLLTRLRWRSRVPLTLVILAGFSLLVRFEPSVLRACAMAVVATLAAALGRPASGVRILGLAVTALLLVDPLLVHSVGFGLSVAASAGILLLAPRMRAGLPGPRWLAEPLAVTLAAQVGTMPLLIVTFGTVPVASVPANLLAVPAAGPLMVWGLTGGLLAGVAPGWLATVLHLPTAVLTWWLAAVARWSAALPLGELQSTHAVALAGCAALWWALRRWRPERAGAALAVACTAVVLAAALSRPMLPVGETAVGDRATVWSGGGTTALVLSGPGAARRRLEDLRRVGVRCVDIVAVTGGGRSAALTANALLRRCPRAVAVAAAGRAHPGWLALPVGTTALVAGARVAVDVDGTLTVGVDPPGPGAATSERSPGG